MLSYLISSNYVLAVHNASTTADLRRPLKRKVYGLHEREFVGHDDKESPGSLVEYGPQSHEKWLSKLHEPPEVLQDTEHTNGVLGWFTAGDRVMVEYQPDTQPGKLWMGTVMKAWGDHLYSIAYDDGDVQEVKEHKHIRHMDQATRDGPLGRSPYSCLDI